MAADSANFAALLVALVSASELTSDLPQALTRYLEHEQRAAEVRHRLISTSIYPLLLMGVGALVLLFLLFYVMPRFARVFEGMGGELPWSARAMVTWSQLLREHAAWLLTCMLGVICTLAAVFASATGRSTMARWILSRAPLRDRLTTYQLSRWYRARLA
jgi:general secretion pathway protein F